MEMIDVPARGGCDGPAAFAESRFAHELRATVHELSVPRHFRANAAANRRVGEAIALRLEGLGYAVTIEGPYRNVVAWPADVQDAGAVPVVGAHYDSVPGTPGADDNASAIAVLLACAAAMSRVTPRARVAFVAFNAEEDGLLGSHDFVDRSPSMGRSLGPAHILEMVGYRSTAPGSQRLPPGVPAWIAPDVGDFLGLLANARSRPHAAQVIRCARELTSAPRIVSLGTYLGIERCFPDLHRSDHSPFWRAGLPAVLWTDTGNFRNPHYHAASDLPDTLDYAFMAQVASLLIASVSRGGK